MGRTKSSVINISVALSGQLIGLIVSFIARIYFIRVLGPEYLGINALFTNILSILSLVELGVGPAIIFSLYKPLADKNTKKVLSLMKFYQKVYIIIGIVIAVLGLCMIPLLPHIINDVSISKELNFAFSLFVINAAATYFFSYKRNLIIADQYRYIATIYRYSFFTILNILQVIFLIITGSYIVFLILQITLTVIENIFVSRHANKMYPFLSQKKYEKIDKATLTEIKKNTKALVLHKVGGIVVTSTDNIIISIYVGIVWVGLYSNYQLMINALNTIIGQFFSAITASVGNLGAKEGATKSFLVFQNIFFFNFWIFGFSSISLLFLANPFIEIWLGSKFILEINIILILIINFFVNGMRRTSLTFTDAFGLYWYSRYKPIFEAIINLVVSLLLASKFGLVGIFFATLVSTLSTCFWVEPKVLFKYGFNKPLKIYFKKYFIYTLAVILAGMITYEFISLIKGDSMLAFFYKSLICFIIPNFVFLILFYQTKEFKYFYNLIKPTFVKFKSKFQ
ncbi:lipopolysaccharide biosynthesis protein [Sporosarcina sp. P29]|uniref:lipopolysaccharide biosynthesis protein n=1 Tax=Sporosarcina sp. P29 TaxID=2048252 RepID=UPI000C163E12|nr:oligosaccharide flippase family protein [Sporosarcina sp. P29]PIC99896.1 sugar translocase [Sporosarcina sp. P29]